ncbi:MAG: hypothetical protein AAGC97_15950 [Planctomycetota bacterium]
MSISRRQLLAAGVLGSIGPLGPRASLVHSQDTGIAGSLETHVPMSTITSGPRFHWFGYYDKRQFDPTGRLVLTNEVEFEGRSPRPDDVIRVGYVDTASDNRFVEIGESRAWGWQQGCMLQFVGPHGDQILWNDRESKRIVCRILDRHSGRIRTLDRPIYTISEDGRTGLSADFRRINNLRPGYGYAGLADPYVDHRHPDQSGVWKVDLESGRSELILSLQQAASIPWPAAPSDAWHYFNHLLINPTGDRFIVLHRYRSHFDPMTRRFQGGFVTRMLTANMDGSNPYVLDPSGYTSHFIWKDERTITAWTRPNGRPPGFYDFTDQSREVNSVGASKMTVNGHNTYLRGDHSDWILNDTYPDKTSRRQTVYLYHVPSGRRFDLGHFPSPPAYRGEWRCDTHPRCSDDGETVCIDSPHARGRQLHLLDIRDVLRQA